MFSWIRKLFGRKRYVIKIIGQGYYVEGGISGNGKIATRMTKGDAEYVAKQLIMTGIPGVIVIPVV